MGDVVWTPGDRVRRKKRDSRGRYWVGVVLGVTPFGDGVEITVKWDHKRSEVWFYHGERLAEIERE